MSNLPDDWGAYYRTCTDCGYRAHASDGYDCKCVETFQCERYYHLTVGSPGERERLRRCDTVVTDEDKLTDTSDGEAWCEHCIGDHGFTCGICDEIFPLCDECCSDNLTTEGEYCCIDCDEKPTSTFDTPKDALAAVVALSMQALSDDTTEGGES